MASVPRDLGRRVARLPEVRAHVRAVAERVLTAAKARAAAHSDSGTFADSLSVVRGRVDAQVESDDPHAVSKEFGHTEVRTGRQVPGIHALGGAAADIAAERG
ncbi:MAG TPA: DUF5403 family protein [Catenuloplanes sp.]|jgi:hypothetical protein